MLGWKVKVILAVTVLFSWSTLGVCQVYSCPPVGEEMVGTCAEECRTDRDCDTPLKCCSNGCGHTCTHPTLTPYHPPPYECPTPNEDIAGTCVEECDNETSCSHGYQCCSNGCGHTCVSICNLIELKLANQTLLGAYQPQCEGDGRFSEAQCHGSSGYCWCVNPVSGEPRSELMRGVDIQCNCSYAGVTHLVGEVFIADDGFNSCTCTVTGIQCTEHRVFHSCPAIREEKEAGICVAECTLDSECPPETKCCYTGCGYSCMTPEVLPYIPIPAMDTCPPTDQVPCVDGGSCEESSEFACDEDTSLCCENDCDSSVCVYRTGPTPCKDARKIVRERNSTHLGLVGVYSPQCDFDGHFKSIQCKEHFCWCVDRHTGKPESDKVAFENLDHLHCSNCVYQGHKYGHLEEFPAGDGCNTCTCVYDGAVSCTELECDEPEDSNLWSWWHSVLIYCVVAVIVLTLLVLVLLMVVVVTMKKNKFRHRKLKEAATVHFEPDMDSVYFKHGQDLNTVELKVPVEDVDNEPDHSKA